MRTLSTGELYQMWSVDFRGVLGAIGKSIRKAPGISIDTYVRQGILYQEILFLSTWDPVITFMRDIVMVNLIFAT